MHRQSAEEFLQALLETLDDLPPDFVQRFEEVLKKETWTDRRRSVSCSRMSPVTERLQRLVMHAFRGVPGEMTVDFGKGESIVVYGDNGTGKSTIADALEWYFTGEIELLVPRGAPARRALRRRRRRRRHVGRGRHERFARRKGRVPGRADA